MHLWLVSVLIGSGIFWQRRLHFGAASILALETDSHAVQAELAALDRDGEALERLF